jgi:small basic protein (TIGR04137 family)
MSLDRSLKSASSLVRHRNVLNRAERLEKLNEDGKWDDNKPVLGLPKVANRKLEVGGKADKEEAAEGTAAATPAAAPAAGAKGAAAPAKGAAPAKAAAPAAGAKGAAKK